MADAIPQAGGTPQPGGSDSSDIDALLNQAAFEDPQAAPAGGGSAAALPASGATDEDIERMLASAAAALPGGNAKPGAGEKDGGPKFDLPSFSASNPDGSQSTIDLLRDVELNVKIELGRSRMLVEDVLKLGEGSVVELDKLAGDPVDVFVNDRLVARGEVLVLNDNFCVRVNEIVAGLKDDVL
jgi:flagellar motor switch protein FliN/FliY